MIQMVALDKIHASTYNPRKSDPKRLDLLELSLRKLGFLSPIVVDQGGEIISGHQRSFVAARIGVKRVPVLIIPRMTLDERKSLNIVFNRATNDLKRSDTCKTVTEYVSKFDIDTIAKDLPDLTPDTPEFYPCMNTKNEDSFELLKKNSKKINQYATTMYGTLCRKKIELPTVIDEDDNVVNGIGRVCYYAERKIRPIPVCRISNKQALFANLMLNYLTMDFDIQNRYADTLRHNSFMRSRNTRGGGLGCGFFKGLWPRLKCEDTMILDGKKKDEWTARFGTSIVDFGAGKLNNTRILRESGIMCSAFEPYFLATGEVISKQESLKIDRKFLAEIADGRKFSTIFISSVFNSVPFMADRMAIATICSALSSPETICVCWTQGVNCGNNIGIKREDKCKNASKLLTFNVDYEPNVVLGDFSALPKVQKYHTNSEIFDIFSPVYGDIYRLDQIDNFVYMECRGTRLDVNNPEYMERLKKAIEFEFNLPYPDGSHAGLVKEAKDAFGKRLGVTIE